MSKLLARLLTRSFPGNRDDLPAAPVIEDDSTSDDSYESRAFRVWESQVEKRQAARILDFGPLRSDSLRFFSERGIDLGIVNLTGTQIADQLERFDDQGPYQGALCWDFPNYLDEEEFSRTGKWLARVLTTGAPVFVALATKRPYPEMPGRYEIVNDMRLRYRFSQAPETRETIYTSGRMSKLWPDLVVDRSFLLRNGMQEFVLKRQ